MYGMPAVPSGKTGVTIVSAPGAEGPGFTVIASVFETMVPVLSRTWITKLKVPGDVGTPVIRPVALLTVSPVGNWPPPSDQDSGGTPPDAESCWLYPVPIEPLGSAPVDSVRLGGLIVRLNVRFADPNEASETTIVKLKVPRAAGVPLSRPFAASVNPCGGNPDHR